MDRLTSRLLAQELFLWGAVVQGMDPVFHIPIRRIRGGSASRR